MSDFKLSGEGEQAVNELQKTPLSPMDEALFHAWAHANQIKKPDDPSDETDYRGLYKASGGKILPNGELYRIAKKSDSEQKLTKLLQQQMIDRMQEKIKSVKDEKQQAHKEERQDVTHKQKMDMEGLKLKRLPHELKMKEHDNQMKQADLQKQQVGNEGKQIDLVASLVKPKEKPSASSQQK